MTLKAARNPLAPHTAIIGVNIQVMEKLPSGELTGDPVSRETRQVIIEGADYHICVRKVNEALEAMKTK